MNPLEIALLVIGIIIIIISCKLVDRPANVINASTLSIESMITEDDKKKLLEIVNERLSEVSDDTIVKTDDTLSQISNEKIMAVHEYSDQILEKIKCNHEEVVFLYNMLNDKEKELKSAVREIDISKKNMKDIMETKYENDRIQAEKYEKSQLTKKEVSQATTLTMQADRMSKIGNHPSKMNTEYSSINNQNTNNNTQILELYSSGRSVVEISKLLGLGQGEVKLVIDLFKGKK